MARHERRSERSEQEESLLPASDEFSYDSLESVTRGLPGENRAEEVTEAPEDEEDDAPAAFTNSIGVQIYGRRRSSAQRSEAAASDEDGAADTPEQALEKLRRSRGVTPEQDEADKARRKRKQQKAQNAPPEEKRSVTPLNAVVRNTLFAVITLAFLLFMGMMLLSQMYPDVGLLKVPENSVAGVMSPLQSAFSSLTNSVASYLRSLKLRANIEAEYNRLVQENEELTYRAMFADELQYQLSQFQDMHAEITSNANLNPITCQVIGKGDGNYFSTFSINRGSNDGIEPFMAVTISGALVGYTETVSSNQATVRTIIDSSASIAGLIQSSRDQGTVRGTLGVDGTPMCRMYYLPDDHLPRPGDTVVTSGVGMSFPKGIPIGTVRESTRGMDTNKQYIVVEPIADFEHIEWVIVLRYKPAAEAITGRESNTYQDYVPLDTARPYPTLRIGSTLGFGETATPVPSITPKPTPSPTIQPTTTPKPTVQTTIAGPVYEYQVVATGPTPTPSPTPSPTPTPYITLNPEDMTLEED